MKEMKKAVKKNLPSAFNTLKKLRESCYTNYTGYRTRKYFSRHERQQIKQSRITSFPEFLIERYVAGRAVNALGCNLKPFSPFNEYDLLISFQDCANTTVNTSEYVRHTYDIYTSRKAPSIILNANCKDVSKKHTGEVFAKIFGYEFNVDPTKHRGPVVKKSDGNATHDGRVIDCPIKQEDVDVGSSYTVLADSSDNGMVQDMRIIWMDSLLDFFCYRRRPVSNRFSNTDTISSLEKISDFFRKDEVAKIGQYARALNLNYGEMDCIRDARTGLLYICDVNKTPGMSSFNGLSRLETERLVYRVAIHFAKQYLLKK